MSLIIDTLKKLKGRGDGGKPTVPPDLLKEDTKAESSSKKRKYILFGLVLITVLSGIAVLGYVYLYLTPTRSDLKVANIKKVNQNQVQKQKLPEKKAVQTQPLSTKNDSVNAQNENKQTTKKVEKPDNSKNRAKTEKKESKVAKDKNVKNLPPPTPPSIRKDVAKPKKETIQVSELNYLILRAEKLVKSGEYEKAIKVYERILKIKPDEKILNNLLILYARQGDTNKIIQKSSKIKGKILYNLTIELVQSGKTKFLEKLLSKVKKHGGFYTLSLAILEEAKGNINTALNMYEKAYLENNHPIIGYYYARAHEIMGKYKEALEVYKYIKKYIANKKLKTIINSRIETLESVVR